MCASPVTVAELFLISKATRARAVGAGRKPSMNGRKPATLYLFRWNRLGRKAQRCRVIARGTMNSCLLEFEDGGRMVTSRNALKRAD